MNSASLGIDTSNYKTSVAIVDMAGEVICDFQQYLEVKKGERGLRQSVALFQHVNNLPALFERAFSVLPQDTKIDCISVSSKPRPVEGSYMPVFNAGVSAARTLAAALSVPCFTFSHQEGHIEAVRHHSTLAQSERFLSFHFSGGTTEGLFVDGETIRTVGGSKDLSIGQVLDRVGVAMGMVFPCGQEMDELVLQNPPPSENILPKIKCQDGYINLSGIETRCQRTISAVKNTDLIAMLFQRLKESIVQMSLQLSEKYSVSDILFAGGVSASQYIRNHLADELDHLNICFGSPRLSTDNAVGTAFLGGKKLWR